MESENLAFRFGLAVFCYMSSCSAKCGVVVVPSLALLESTAAMTCVYKGLKKLLSLRDMPQWLLAAIFKAPLAAEL